MTLDERYINDVLANVPPGAIRAQIGMDLRAHIAERVEQGQSVEDAIRQFGDPRVLAESYLAAVPLESASFGGRAVAKAIDVLLLAIPICAEFWLMWRLLGPPGKAFYPGITETKDPLIVAICVLTLVGLVPAYFIVAEYYTGQTLGKRVLELRVVRESGARISLGQSFVRQLPLMASIFVLDILFAPFTEHSQRAFELVSKTRTVRADLALAGEPRYE